ncbi:hypothetical protein SAMN04515617_13710 [Collimonas sp. OK242]|jgi:hypothetical protein|uniref:hypothetical protein n=1 Tax=Collimonas sp. OK242 TaxID=1798195 RepID=UPI0008961D66|nr:hypothetical protein [Collimonas sp. OK242]SDY96610.1 hypothetical protein SAMN04515617_13710 [Collimonas sp. OK242]
MTILANILFSLLALIAASNTWAAGNEQATILYLRPAANEEIFGVWSAKFTGGSFYHFRYVAITADGRIGWAVSNTEPIKINRAAVIEAINKMEMPDGLVTGWQRFTVSDGKITVAAGEKVAEQYFTMQALTDSQDSASHRAYISGNSGDLVMQQFYRISPDWPASGPPPHMLSPAPWVLQRLAD